MEPLPDTRREEIRDVLTTGLRWLYDTGQPDGAILQHHGSTLPFGEANRWFGFVPAGAANLPVVHINVGKVEWTDEGPINPLEPGELEALADEITALGFEVSHTWNGHPAVTGSVGLKRAAHPTLLAAVNQYLAGCLEHPKYGRGDVFCDCGWYGRGNALVVQPTRAAAVPVPAVADDAL
jgi:hypothetical protein